MNQSDLDRMIARGAANGLLPRSVKAKAARMGFEMPGTLVDNSQARAHAAYLHSLGMPLRQIARKAGTTESTISEMLSGKRGKGGQPHSGLNRRNVVEAILAVQPETFDTARGARMPALGAQRRVRALGRVGFTGQSMSVYLGHESKTRSYVGAFLVGKYTHQNVHDQIDAMYRKLRYADPLDFGVTKWGKSAAIKRAERKGWPGPDCWDDDLIDDPNAYPEWTGACGSMKGVRLHHKHSIMPLCDLCAEAQREELRKLKENY